MSLEQPRISVITPSFNQGHFIRETVESVLGQDESVFEYLVVDGGSEDETLEVLEPYRDRLHLISGPDRGQSDAINQGMDLAQGEVFGWLNADDCYLPGTLTRVARFFDQNPGVDVVYGKAEEIDAQGDFLQFYPTGPFDPDRLLDHCLICQPAAFMRRRFWQRFGPLDIDLHYCMDYDLWLRGSWEARFVFLPVPLARTRSHFASKSSRRREALNETLRMLARNDRSVSLDWLFASASVAWFGASRLEIPGLSKLGAIQRRLRIPGSTAKGQVREILLKGRMPLPGRLRMRADGRAWIERELLPERFECRHTWDGSAISEIQFEILSPPGAGTDTAILHRVELKDDRGRSLARFSRTESLLRLWLLIPLFLREVYRCEGGLRFREVVRFLLERWRTLRHSGGLFFEPGGAMNFTERRS